MSGFDIDSYLDDLLDGKPPSVPPATLERPRGRPPRPARESASEARTRQNRRPQQPRAAPAPVRPQIVAPPAAVPPPAPAEVRFDRGVFYRERLRLLGPLVASGKLTWDEARDRAEADTRTQEKLFGGNL